MAETDDGSITIQVEDEAVVEVPIDPKIAATATQSATIPEPKKPAADPKKVVRQRATLDDEGTVTGGQVATPDHEKLLAEAKAFAEQQEAARKAAEATAASERNMREAADRARQRAQKEAEEASQRAESTELTLIESSIAATEQALANEKEAYTRAAEAGEFPKMGEIQIKLAKHAAALDRLEAAKASVSARKAAEPTHEGRVGDTVAKNAVEEYVSQFNPTAQTWIRQHMDCLPPELGGDAGKNAKMMAGHYLALSQNHAVNSPDYFKVIEENIGFRQPAAAATTTAAASPAASKAAETTPAAPARAAAVPAAPPTRDAPSASGQAQPRNVAEVRLTREQQEMARISFPHLTDAQAFGAYARNLLELEAEGKMGRKTH